ncbi:anti-sigma factor [Cellulomonas sp. PS-H5]|uniref:anti-sigma factor n=1 Tax=Cellulomonas sp. PS-H5 TaxID=2820400 RepID=UPI001C4F0876|nr:anti-sigma factor [Cellulomonas sp. PS-H5]MBW0252921.1 anti-sigma factor [Cellulomonas sp. PS-H5]
MTTPTPPRPGERRPDDAATRELLGAWALDALDDAERARVDDLVARDPDAAREARSLRETAAVLGEAVAVAAPDAVRLAVLAEVERTRQEDAAAASAPEFEPVRPAAGTTAPGAAASGTTGGEPVPSSVPARPTDRARTGRPAGAPGGSTRPTGSTRPAGRRARRRWSTAVAALAVLAAVAVPSTVAWRQSERAAEAEARADRITTLLAEPGAQVVSAPVTSGGTAVAVVTADAALVTASGVDAPGADQVYQLWVMRDGAPVPAGTTGVTDGTLQIRTDAYRTGDALALTVEPEGGSEQPTSEPVVVLAPA